MKPPYARKQLIFKNSKFAIAAGICLVATLVAILWFAWPASNHGTPYRHVSTVAGTSGEFSEAFGIAVKGSDIYMSDGESGRIWLVKGGTPAVFTEGLDTPSAIAFDENDKLIVADSGTHTIKSVNSAGEVATIAGVENRSGFVDGDAAEALFNAPVGIAVHHGTIYVADTYNDRIRVIENGRVATIVGSGNGFADGVGPEARFDTPCGLAIWRDKLLVADTGNRRIRVIEPDGRVWTLAGNGDGDLRDGLLSGASFVQPTAVAIDKNGSIFVADGNAIRQIVGDAIPVVRTISGDRRGLKDGNSIRARFNRPSSLAFDTHGDLLVADSENRLLRKFEENPSGHEITADEIEALRDKPEEFRALQPARWPYDPPSAKRDIAGTLGEIRGEVQPGNDEVWFHNGLDIAGVYGETARFIRDEKVLRPLAIENFGNSRESIRMPTLGYIHIRVGRDLASMAFDDRRFQFAKDGNGKLSTVRVPRGTKFGAGEPIGTLNAMNHVHLIAGRSGGEMNSLAALTFPNLQDSRPPNIEKVSLFDEFWREIETVAPNSRIMLKGKTRVVVRAFDQMDGNSDRRRLGIYKLGYQIVGPDGIAQSEPKWMIAFDRLPAAEAVPLVYANGSKSGATGETIFNYIVTNFVNGDEFREDLFDATTLENGSYILRVIGADYFGNTTSKDLTIEVLK